MIVRQDDQNTNIDDIIDIGISDHSLIIGTIQVKKPSPTKQIVSFRKYRHVNPVCVASDITESRLAENVSTHSNIDNKLKCFSDTISRIVDKHTPLVAKVVTICPSLGWYTQKIRQIKRDCRRAEKKVRRTKSEKDKKTYKSLRNSLNHHLWEAKRDWVAQRTEAAGNNTKEVYKIINSLTKLERRNDFPDTMSDTECANEFTCFFSEKIEKIRENLQMPAKKHFAEERVDVMSSMQSFESTTPAEIRKVIMSSPNKTCQLDVIPTILLKSEPVLDTVTTCISDIINESIASGNVPSVFKEAIVTPLLKKNLDTNELQNYRPVSNLSFISKCLEKVVAVRIKEHLNRTGSYDKFQSAYKSGHSTETALLRVHSDICVALDKGMVVLLVLLDLSAAFDTIDHHILINRLSTLGFGGIVTRWVLSYLQNRFQRVKVNESMSMATKLPYGVPQGSVLGPLLFTIYILPLSKIIEKHGIQHHIYADDTQLYVACKPEDINSNCRVLESCISDIKQLMDTTI